MNNFKNFGWVERLAFAPTSCPLTGRFRLTTPLSAKKTSASPTRFATAELKLANRKLRTEADDAAYEVRHCGKRLCVASLNIAGTLDETLKNVRRIAEKIIQLRKDAARSRGI